MSQKVARYRRSVDKLVKTLPGYSTYWEISHQSKNGKTYFEIYYKLDRGNDYNLTIAVDKITAQAAIVDEAGKDITEEIKSYLKKEMRDNWR